MLPFLKPKPHRVIEWVRESVSQSVGSNLRSLVLFGRHAAESWDTSVEVNGSVQVLIVLQKVNLTALQQLRDTFAASRLATSVSPMVLSLADLHASADVFPITYMEMKREHKLLSGEDVLAEIDIRQDHLRLRCEQELKNLSLRLQSALLTHGTRPTQLLMVLRRSYSAYARAVRAALVLFDVAEQPTDAQLSREAESRFELKQGVLERVAQLCNAGRHGNEVVSAAFQEFLLAVNQTAAHVDALPSGVTVLAIGEEDDS